MSDESRRARRRQVADTVLVTDAMTDAVIGRIGNLSETGMLLIASAPLNEDALYQFRFTLPDGDGRTLEVGAHVLWRDDASAPNHSWVGVRFLGLSPEAARLLREWVGQGADAS